VLEVRRLTKYYTRIPAVEEANFSVAAGEVLGLLGPNGSGKSTIVNMLTGLIEPTEGEILFEGRDVRRNPLAFRALLGYVPEIPHLYPYLSGREYLQLVGRLRLMREPVIAHKADRLMELLGMRADRHSPISAYSKGMRQKVLIAAALLHNPRVLVFDEPLSGLDVTSALVFRSLVKALANEGKVIVYSSHVLEAVEKICSKVLILQRGKIVANDSVANLRNLMQAPSLEDVFSQLVLHEDTQQVAAAIVAVVGSTEGRA
jgi:ABC-2 type transport system ATP-binding protein